MRTTLLQLISPLIILLLIILAPTRVFAASGSHYFSQSGNILKQNSCWKGIFDDYAQWMDFLVKKNKRMPPEKTKAFLHQTFPQDKYDTYKASLECVVFIYKVDEVNVQGFYMAPKPNNQSLKESSPLPVIIYNRGGNGGFSAVNFATMMKSLMPLSEKGFIVIGSQYRGSRKGSKKQHPDNFDEFGGKDIDDVMALFNIVDHIPNADKKRIAMVGASRGAMTSFLTAQKTDRIKAMAIISGLSDLHSVAAARPKFEKMLSKRIPNYANNKQQALNERSAIKNLNKLQSKMPVLIIHGNKDDRIPVDNALKLDKALEEQDITKQLITYDDDHFLRAHQEEMRKEIVSWFKRYL